MPRTPVCLFLTFCALPLFAAELLAAEPAALTASSIESFGAKGDGAADDSAAIIAALKSGSMHVTAGCGTYALGSVSIVLPPTPRLIFEGTCAHFTYAGKDSAFSTSSGATYQTINIGSITRTSRDWVPPGADSTSIGLKIIDTSNSNFCIGNVANFHQGVLLTTATHDTAGNTFHCLQANDNKIGLHLQPAKVGGTNQNLFLNPQVRISGGRQCPDFAVSAVTNTAPMIVTAPGVGTALNSLTNKSLRVSGVKGNNGVNGVWRAAYVDANRISLVGSSGGGGSFAGGGNVTVPLAGTKYIWLDTDSDNMNTFINAEIQNECPEYSAYVEGALNTFIAPRLELNLPGAFAMASEALANSILAPYVASGRYASNEINDVSGRNFIQGPTGYYGSMPLIGGDAFFRFVNPSNVLQYSVNQGQLYLADGIKAGAGAPCTPVPGRTSGDICAGGSITAKGVATAQWNLCSGAHPFAEGFGAGIAFGPGSNACSGDLTIGSAPAGTIRLEFAAAPNNWVCTLQDLTAGVILRQTKMGSTSCTFAGTVNAGDVLTYMAAPH